MNAQPPVSDDCRATSRPTSRAGVSNPSRRLGGTVAGQFWKSLLFRTGSEVANAVGLLNLLECMDRRNGCLFLLHRVARSEDWGRIPDRSFFCDLDRVEIILQYLKASGWKFLTISDVIMRLRERVGRRGRFVNFSVDDTYRDTYELLIPLFRRLGVPLTLYVTSGIPDGSCALWWAGLNTILHERASVCVPRATGEQRLRIDTPHKKRRLYSLLHSAWQKQRPLSC
jgi:hypothetical protein